MSTLFLISFVNNVVTLFLFYRFTGCYVEISDIAFCIPNKELDTVDRLAYDEQLNAFREQLSSEDSLKLDRLLAGECFRGRKKMIRELRVWMVDFDPCNEED